ASPLNSLAAFQAINNGASGHPAANANIFLYDSATGYTGPVTLLNGQKLIGQDATASLATITGLTPGASSAPLPPTGGGSPNHVSITSTVGMGNNAVSVGNGNTITGLTLTGSANALISGAPAGLTVDTVSMTPSGADGFSITGGSGTVALTNVT